MFSATRSGFSSPSIAPHRVCPHTMTSLIPRAAIANSTVASSPPGVGLCGGTMFPALRTMNSSPGSVWVIRFGLTRLSEQVTNRASGRCPSASRSNHSRRGRNTFAWKSWIPCTNRCMGVLRPKGSRGAGARPCARMTNATESG
jgi:hypothetical protein